ncbi:MAG: hypothetical protein ACJAVM_003076 [Sulfitobacter sp.]|jgi:hypothetical protein
MKPVFSISALVFSLAASAANAGDVCMPAGELKASLIDWYGEQPIAEPTEKHEQLWASKQTGTWTMVKTLADGNACVIGQGDNWMAGVNQREMLAALDQQ